MIKYDGEDFKSKIAFSLFQKITQIIQSILWTLLHNTERLITLTVIYLLYMLYICFQNGTSNLIEKSFSRNQIKTGDHGSVLPLKIDAQIMITSNIDVLDKLSNGQIGTVAHFKLENKEGKHNFRYEVE